MRIEPTGELRQRRPREHDERHLRFIRSLPCAVLACLRDPPSHAAHLRAGALIWNKRPTGVGEKPSDRWTIPLCAHHHLIGQHTENEIAWWARQGRDPFSLAHALYDCSGDLENGLLIVRGLIIAKVPF